ncbi:MAG: hypothetical protein SGI73_05205 [Chloroflexota bacterium]|nr:hypothetical protein [Chloroflexota bacterium]
MTIIEVRSAESTELTQRQRWSHYFTLFYGVIAVVIALNLRDSTLNATRSYVDIQAGIRAAYPQTWIIDTGGASIFRARDMAVAGFKTTIQIAIRPISLSTSTRNLIDILTLTRAQTLAAYRVLSQTTFFLNEVEATELEYTYVSSDDNPFLAAVPIVVRGRDILITRGGQAIIVTFLADANTYEQNLPSFQRFLADLEF